MTEINKMIIDFNAHDDLEPGNGGGSDSGDEMSDQPKNSGTIILDATCAPQNISYLQDVNLLNEVRGNLEGMIDELCCEYGYYRPRIYRKNARKDYLNLAKCKKRIGEKDSQGD